MTNRKRTRAAPQASATHEILSFVSRTDRTLEPCHADSSLREKMGASWCFPTIFPDENFFLVSQAKDNKPGGKEDFPARRAPPSTSYADTNVPIPRSRVVLPLEQGTLVRAQRRDGEWLLARVVEVNVVQGAPDQSEYYLHFKGDNKRLDCWRPLSALDLDTVVPPQGVDSETESEEGEGHEMYDAETWQSHNELTRVKNVDRMEMGKYEMETWYWSPLPPEFSGVRKSYVCEYDLAFFKRRDQMLRHLQKVRVQHPPGMEIYRHNGISMFEVDGTKAQNYCENLCYIAKLFLDHKSLVHGADLFLYYVMCECDSQGAHIVGYFSKEKVTDNNLACILTFPAYQRRGYGKFLISFSYELSKLEQKVGTPERPLSDLGARSYYSYWTRTILSILKEKEGSISIQALSEMTMIKSEDIVSTLHRLNMIQNLNGQHVICAAPNVIEAHLKKCGSPGLLVEPSKIIWTPFPKAPEEK